MRVFVITQEEPFFLPESIQYFLKLVQQKHDIVGATILSPSPFGKKESFFKKARKTQLIFGAKFFLHYSFLYIWRKLILKKSCRKVLQNAGIPTIELERSINDESSLFFIKECRPDILVSIAGNEIFKKPLIDLAPKGCLNLHTAELPKYRGLMPTFWVLKNTETHTSVSVFLVDEGIDSGPIVVQKTVSIGDKTQEKLIQETKKIGMETIVEALDIMKDPNPPLIKNDASEATYFGFPTAEDVLEFRRVGARFY